MPLEATPTKRVRVVLLGGTIDSKSYKHTKEFQEQGEPPKYVDTLSTSTVERYVAKRYAEIADSSLIELKDSQKINPVDMNQLLDLITLTYEPVKVVAIGTDAMAKRAREASIRLGKNNDKVILFVGAMEPLSHGPQSDGYGNLDFAMQVAQSTLEPGVYVAMPDREGIHRIFRADDALRKEATTTRVKEGGRIHKYFTGNIVTLPDGPMPTTLPGR